MCIILLISLPELGPNIIRAVAFASTVFVCCIKELHLGYSMYKTFSLKNWKFSRNQVLVIFGRISLRIDDLYFFPLTFVSLLMGETAFFNRFSRLLLNRHTFCIIRDEFVYVALDCFLSTYMTTTKRHAVIEFVLTFVLVSVDKLFLYLYTFFQNAFLGKVRKLHWKIIRWVFILSFSWIYSR